MHLKINLDSEILHFFNYHFIYDRKKYYNFEFGLQNNFIVGYKRPKNYIIWRFFQKTGEIHLKAFFMKFTKQQRPVKIKICQIISFRIIFVNSSYHE